MSEYVSAYLPVIFLVGSIVAAIICVQVFYTFWGPINRRFSDEKPPVSRDVQLAELREGLFNVHLKSGLVLVGMVVAGYTSNWGSPFEFKQFLILKDKSGKQYYARVSEIEYFERTGEQQ